MGRGLGGRHGYRWEGVGGGRGEDGIVLGDLIGEPHPRVGPALFCRPSISRSSSGRGLTGLDFQRNAEGGDQAFDRIAQVALAQAFEDLRDDLGAVALFRDRFGGLASDGEEMIGGDLAGRHVITRHVQGIAAVGVEEHHDIVGPEAPGMAGDKKERSGRDPSVEAP